MLGLLSYCPLLGGLEADGPVGGCRSDGLGGRMGSIMLGKRGSDGRIGGPLTGPGRVAFLPPRPRGPEGGPPPTSTVGIGLSRP